MGLVDELGLYVHWPWCVRKCPYCDFNSYAGVHRIEEARYIEALLADLEQEVRGESRCVRSVFFGGGTPSLMTAAGFERLMQGIRDRVPLAVDAEVTLEANPGTVESSRFEAYAQAGVNRISLGIQSFNDESLRNLGRIHTVDQAREAIGVAKRVFKNINLDVMFALPGQTLTALRAEIDAALACETTHLSFYELSIEEGSAFYKHPPKGLPDADLAADMADSVDDALSHAGFEHYEVSGYARPGWRCRHNLIYWTYADYIGIGAGAHGKLTRSGIIRRTTKVTRPLEYMCRIEAGDFEQASRVVPREEIAFEFMLNVLRLREGVSEDRWEATTGLPLQAIQTELTALRDEGLLQPTGRIAPTPLGARFLSEIQARFLSQGKTWSKS